MHTESAASPTLIQSLQRGMRLVEAVTLWGPLTARELSNQTGIVLPTTYHLVRTLVHEGYLRRSADGRYSPGVQMTSVNQLEHRARSLRLTRQRIAELAGQARATVSIGELRDGDIRLAQFATHPSTPKFECWRGMVLPVHATAIGKSILGRMSDRQRLDCLDRHPLEALTTHTITTSARLNQELVGAALTRSDQEFAYGICCIAVPLGPDEAPMALGAAFASSRSQRAQERIESIVSGTAERIADAMCIASNNEDGIGLSG